MEANLRRYRIYLVARDLHFWLPVFFLYMSSRVGLEGALQLEAIYYAAVVVLEVPSGWLSDRFGRRRTLLVSTTATAVAHLFFAFGSTFAAFAVAQGLLAAGKAFWSGTDESLLYDSLQALERQDEFADQQARAQAAGNLAQGAAAIVAGVVAGIDLRLPYLIGLVPCIAAILIVAGFREPPSHQGRTPFRSTLRTVASRMRDSTLAWSTALVVAVTILNHVPYEFTQPYVELLFATTGEGYDPVPVVTGLLAALAPLAAAFAAHRAVGLAARLGTVGALLSSVALQLVIIAAMGFFLHPALLLLVLLRSVPRAIQTPLLGALVHPRLESRYRATFVSLQSLLGRLAFSATLLGAVALAENAPSGDDRILSKILLAFAAIGAVALLGLIVSRPGPPIERPDRTGS